MVGASCGFCEYRVRKSGAVRCSPAATAAQDGARPPASPVPLSHLSIAPGQPSDPGSNSRAVHLVNAHHQRQPAPRRGGEHLPQDQQDLRVDGRHQSAPLKDRKDGDNGYETAGGGRPSGDIVGIEEGWQPGLSLIHPVPL